MSARDLIGKRGEAIVCAALLNFCGRETSYFDPHPLGEKCPIFDYLVELVGLGNVPAYFLAQVKATKQGYTGKRVELKAGVSADDVRKMVNCPVPVYVIGVDEPGEVAYLLSVHSRRGAISSIPTTHPLDPTTLRGLWAEVRDQWKQLRAIKRTSAFV